MSVAAKSIVFQFFMTSLSIEHCLQLAQERRAAVIANLLQVRAARPSSAGDFLTQMQPELGGAHVLAQLVTLHSLCAHLRKQVPAPTTTPQPPPPPPQAPPQVNLIESLLSALEDGLQQRKAMCATWMRDMRRMSRDLSAAVASMKAQVVLLPLPSGEETLFDFINEDEVKVRARTMLQQYTGGSVCRISAA
jgi:hypothetical protein